MGIVERKEREREARRNAILDAAEAVFKLKGFVNATMDDIARDAELAKGTVYLYYRSKEELQVGLVKRGLDLMAEFFQKYMEESNATGLARMEAIGEAYWHFAEEHFFYFALMHIMDLPYKQDQVSNETLCDLQGRSDELWKNLTGIIDEAKAEGSVKQDVGSFSVAMLLWLNCTGILRFHHKVRSTPDSVWSQRKQEFNPCLVDFKQLYDLNNNLLLHSIVTEKGLSELAPVQWPSNIIKSVVPSSEMAEFSANEDAEAEKLIRAFATWPLVEEKPEVEYSL